MLDAGDCLNLASVLILVMIDAVAACLELHLINMNSPSFELSLCRKELRAVGRLH